MSAEETPAAAVPGEPDAPPAPRPEPLIACRVERYRPAHACEWDGFVRASRNGTFLLERGYMDYHAERFRDHSLLIRDAADRLLALLPANRDGDVLHSHQGLTYGGFVYGDESRALDASALLQAVLRHLRSDGFAQLHYKAIPSIYHRQPAEEDRLALFEAGASLAGRHALSVLSRDGRVARRERLRRSAGPAWRAGIQVIESDDAAAFWTALGEALQARYSVGPVHNLDEIELLRARFPRLIRLFVACSSGEPVAGVLVFDTHRVARVQYMWSAPEGRRVAALDAVFSHLFETIFPDKPWFDFGSSELPEGGLNPGLILHKEGFGARTVMLDRYLLPVAA